MYKNEYDKHFYETMNEGKCSNYTSSNEIVPHILELFPRTKSVLDLGCGTGTWLHAFFMHGVNDLTGIDGEWVDKNSLMIDEDNIIFQDLKMNIELGRKYDIAMSVEVGEHLDEKYADRFVDNLVRHSDVVVFGAAVPNQGGTHHVNEQWQSYWIAKFDARGYLAIDPIRSSFWNNSKVMACYANNTLVYINKDKIENYPEVKKYIGVPFVPDFCLNRYYVIDNKWHGGPSIFTIWRQQKIIITTLIRWITGNIESPRK